jgi:hypothetical protein
MLKALSGKRYAKADNAWEFLSEEGNCKSGVAIGKSSPACRRCGKSIHEKPPKFLS